MHNPIVVKIGGAALEQQRDFVEQIGELAPKHPLVIVHGGGKLVSRWLGKHDIMPEFIRGVRYTDETTLEVAAAVLSGLVNSQIVASLQRADIPAVGLSGVSFMQGVAGEPELGYVATEATPIGDIGALFAPLSRFVVVCAPLVYAAGESKAKGADMLNMNADTFAGYLAVYLKAARLVLVTDTEGVLDTAQRLIPHLTPSQAEDLIEMGGIRGGMIPKIRACLTALSENNAVEAHIVGGGAPNALVDLANGKKVGTSIYLPQI